MRLAPQSGGYILKALRKESSATFEYGFKVSGIYTYNICVLQSFEGQRKIFAISRAGKGCNEFAGFVGDANFAVREAFVVEHFPRLGIKPSAAFGTEKVD